MDWAFWLIGFLIVAYLFVKLLKRYLDADSYLGIIAMVRTTRPLKWFDRLSRIGRPLDWFAEFGLILGFGAIAVDYRWGRQLSKPKRALLFLLSFVALVLFFYLFDLLTGRMLSTNPLSMNYMPVFAAGFGIMGFAGFTILTLVFQAYDIITKLAVGRHACPGVAPLIPGVEIPGMPITVPLHAWLSLIIILVIHEGMHGIIARREKFNVKSTGVLLLGFLPIGAFVEPDEEQIKKANPKKALRVFSAGPTANLAALPVILVLVLVISLLLGLVFGPWASQYSAIAVSGVVVKEVDQNVMLCREAYPSPAYGVLRPGMTILKVNDVNVRNAAQVQKEIAEHRYEPIKLTLKNKDNEIEEYTLTPNEIGAFGFRIENIKNELAEVPESYWMFMDALSSLNSFIAWLFILNLLLALVNFLPLGVFDGGRIATILFLPYFSFLKMSKEDTEKLIARIFLWIVLALLITNALPLFIF